MMPSPAPIPSNPLEKIIDDLRTIIDRQAADPGDPELKDLLLDVQVELSKAAKTFVGVGDDTNRGG
jgi:hypothetical protein